MTLAQGRRRWQRGFVTAEFMAAVAFSFIVLAVIANLVVFAYARGVARAAVDDGARVFARADATAAQCISAVRQVLDGLLGGSMRSGLSAPSCAQQADGTVSVTVTGRLRGWLPLVGDLPVHAESVAVRDPSP